ncbi:AarF/UbiB family protein [Myxococcus stipitatus]|uniref:AarF/UbiB family protein n=1 Tax=Myxococcus stipitatus TaxID=83455 RepID=UPI0030D2C0E5
MRASRFKRLDPDLVPTPLRERPPHAVEISELTIDPERRRVVLKPPMSMWGKLSNPVLTSPAERGAIVRNPLDELGGVFIKLGQLLALHKDLFPTVFCLALSNLHDRVTAFPPGVARRYLEETIGRPLESVFSASSPVPVASIGQCHIARLREGGHLVAVKLQSPDAPSMFWRDIDLFQSLRSPLDIPIQKLLPTLDHLSEMKRNKTEAQKRARKKAWNVRPSMPALLQSGAILRHNEEASLALTNATNLRRVQQLGMLRFKSSLPRMEFLILSAWVGLGLALLAFWLIWQAPLHPDVFGWPLAPAGDPPLDIPRFDWWEGLLLLALCGKAFRSANRVAPQLHENVT